MCRVAGFAEGCLQPASPCCARCSPFILMNSACSLYHKSRIDYLEEYAPGQSEGDGGALPTGAHRSGGASLLARSWAFIQSPAM